MSETDATGGSLDAADVKVLTALWADACFRAVMAVPAPNTERTKGDPTYGHRVVSVARGIFAGFFDTPVR